MGDDYPSASILGVDLSPIQPEWVPPNVCFMADDVEASWLEGENFYDYVHGRHITPAIKDFPALVHKAYKCAPFLANKDTCVLTRTRHTKPGGYFEIQEMQPMPHCDDDTMPADWPLLQYYNSIHQGLAVLGIDINASREELSNLSRYGFINVHHEILKVPIGPWAKNKKLKTIGMYCKAGVNDGLEAMAYGPLCRGLGWSRDEVELLLVSLKESLDAPDALDVHAYLPFHVFWGQKPLDGGKGG